jgi:Right handed beta helix region
MPINQLPEVNDLNWGTPLNNYIRVSTDAIGSINHCDIIYCDESKVRSFLDTVWPPIADYPQSQNPIFPIPEDLDFIINRKTSKIYKKVSSFWIEFVPDEGFSVISKWTGSVFRFKGNSWVVTSANNWVNIRDWGARGDAFGGVNYGTDATESIQAAVMYASQANNVSLYAANSGFNGKSVTVFVPTGIYTVSDEILVPDIVNILGDGGASYGGSRIGQTNKDKSLFVLIGPNNGSSFTNLFLSMIAYDQVSPSANSLVAAIKGTPGISQNSIYIRDCFFQVQKNNVYAIYMDHGDDIQISRCTFDVGEFAIRLGSVTDTNPSSKKVTNCTIENNTFYYIRNTAIQLINTENTNIIGNRIYGGSAADGSIVQEAAIATYIGTNEVVKNLNIIGNTIDNSKNPIKIKSIDTNITISNNSFTSCKKNCLSVGGGSVLNNLIFTSNVITGNFSPIAGQYNDGGAISAGGTGLTNSIIKDNIIQGNLNGTDSTVGINLNDPRVLGNNIKENIIYGFTTPKLVNNPAGNILT